MKTTTLDITCTTESYDAYVKYQIDSEILITIVSHNHTGINVKVDDDTTEGHFWLGGMVIVPYSYEESFTYYFLCKVLCIAIGHKMLQKLT